MDFLTKRANSISRVSKSDAPLVVKNAPILPISLSVTAVLMVSQWIQPTPAKNAMIFAWLVQLQTLPTASHVTLDGPWKPQLTHRPTYAQNVLTPVVEYVRMLILVQIVKTHFILDLMENAPTASLIARFVQMPLHALNATMVILSTFNKTDLSNANCVQTDVLLVQSWLTVKNVTQDFSWTAQLRPAKSVHKTVGTVHHPQVAKDA